MKSFLLLLLFVTAVAYAEENKAMSFVTVRVVKIFQDVAGNEQDDIVVTNTHESRSIRVTVGWISVAREREIDANVKPGQQKIIARNQADAREVRITRAQFK